MSIVSSWTPTLIHAKYLTQNAELLEHFFAKSYQIAACGVAEMSANVLSHTSSIRDIALVVQRDLEQMDTRSMLKVRWSPQTYGIELITCRPLAPFSLHKDNLKYGKRAN